MKRLSQIDFLKGISIIMVLVQHSINLTYSGSTYGRAAVSMFMLMGGVTAYISFSSFLQKRRTANICPTISDSLFNYSLKRMWKLFGPYMIYFAVFLFAVNGVLSVAEYREKLLDFTLWNSMWYIPVYLELIFITPLLYYAVERSMTSKHPMVASAISMAIVALIMYGLTYVVCYDNVFGGGKYLFGASYGILYFIGIFFGRYITTTKKEPNYTLHMIISTNILLVWGATRLLFADFHYNIGRIIPNLGGNPAGLSQFFGGLILAYFLWCLSTLVQKRQPKLLMPFILLGKYSLYIYLYHSIIKYVLLIHGKEYGFAAPNPWLAIPYYLGSTVGVILMCKLIELFKRSVVKVFSGKTEETVKQ